MDSIFAAEVADLGFTTKPMDAHQVTAPDGSMTIIVCGASVYMYFQHEPLTRTPSTMHFGTVDQAQDAALRIAKGWLIGKEYK